MSWSSLLSMITRGKVASATVSERTVLQVTGLDNEAFSGVELVQPYGRFGLPPKGADIIILQVNGTRDHKIAFAGDVVNQAPGDLESGEFGDGAFGSTIIYRQGKLSISSTLPIEVTSSQTVTISATQSIGLAAPVITSGAAGGASQKVCLEAFFDWAASHTHPGTDGPSTPPPASGLSTNFGAT